ncbi:hypothetical protein MTX26_36175 (plasmid) [Bradyrhizobium sp. ISRA443]|uniref:BTAD domain-containing putative transcriptional regulator n=1 Tax=unclassified Bradyrhizobium TaxID=2631580 RepID=UPI00247896ED|nr:MULTISPECIES: BTAD domain-containing putative transcriptional regulator [unclassified Bradyrhizobium]WGS03018.1 hypothetical protein MTX23_35875 [Bradyrhizobium sp. ISRA436]WGS09947.1 hypothetical protein MTX18_36170 [Bradyrhizobium sp. ISRA437]WGS16832.1 hypothetical protein MTX26_36175 [Bradyrhizobium sp. ISRA443]
MNRPRGGSSDDTPQTTGSGPRLKQDLQLDLLGDFVARSGTQTLGPLPKKARGLLAYLTMHRDQAIPRETLALLFWQDSGGERARRSLRECVMDIRTAFGQAANVLVTTSQAIAMSADVDIDVQRFERLARSNGRDDLEAAFALYRDEFLFGLDIASESFSEWLSFERQRMSSLASDLGCRLAMALRQADRLEAASEAAERVVRIDPLREDAHRLLMKLFSAAGNRSAALRQYASCREILKRELGVAPEQATSDLAATIGKERAYSASPAPKPAEGAAPAKARQPLGMSNRTAIAVLPVCNLAGQDQHYFAEGISEELSIALGRVPWLFVISSSSAAPYRGGATDLERVSAELGVRYALRGSVRRENDRVRIVAQLLHTANGGQLWAERFEGRSNDLFAIQDRIVGQACAKLAPALQSVEINLSRRKRDRNLSAYDLYLRALPRHQLRGQSRGRAHADTCGRARSVVWMRLWFCSALLPVPTAVRLGAG